MIASAKITHRFLTEQGLFLQVFVPMVTEEYFRQKETDDCEIIFIEDDTITAEQRKRIYATLNDISVALGYTREEGKQLFKEMFQEEFGIEELSFKDCTKYVASDFIDFLLEFCFYHNIPLKEEYGINRAYNITHYLQLCLRYKKCCICGKPADEHHEDAIGMGNNRKKTDDTKKRKMALCREHHTESHTIGDKEFQDKYHVYGIIWNEEPSWIDKINMIEEENCYEGE